MKISWGVKIVVTFVVFAGGIIFLVGISMMQNSDLVSENYYENELKYQDKIDIIKRTNSLPEKIRIEVKNTSIVILYPGIFINEKITGNVNFYRTSDKKKDFNVSVYQEKNCVQEISTSNIDKGSWKVMINWKVNGQDYFSESEILIL